jgi:hypothetical protein
LGRDILPHIVGIMIAVGTGRMAIGIGRRQFISALGGSAFARPVAVRAQQPAMPVIGFLHSSSPEPMVNFVAAYRKGLSEAGFVEGQNVAIEFPLGGWPG